jgi:hypothetical protein
MFVMTLAAVAAAGEVLAGVPPRAVGIALIVIVAGAAATAAVRVQRIAAELRAR